MMRIKVTAEIILTDTDHTGKPVKGGQAVLAFDVERKLNDMGHITLDNGHVVGIRVHMGKIHKGDIYNDVNRQQAVKMDTDYYVEENDGIYYVLGRESGFAYESYTDRDKAVAEMQRLRDQNTLNTER